MALFGSFDSNIKLIEREFGVKITCRGSELKIDGDAEQAAKATTVIESLLQFLSRGEALSDQNVRYCISLVNSGSEDKIEELAGDCICITSKGKPIKPKTIGQKRCRYGQNLSCRGNGGDGFPQQAGQPDYSYAPRC